MLNRIIFPVIILVFFAGCKTDYRSAETKVSYTILHDSLSLHDQESGKLIRPYKDSVDKIMNEIIGVSGTEMFTAKPQGSLGNFVADLLYYDIPVYKEFQYLNFQPSFALINTRGLRARLPKGNITKGKIYEIMPFENKIVIAKMPAETFSEIGDFLVASGGHPFSKNINLAGDNGTLEYFSINNRQPAGDYYIITTDYLASGGDNMHFFTKAIEIKDTGILLRDQIMIHIQDQHKKNRIIQGETDERIILFR